MAKRGRPPKERLDPAEIPLDERPFRRPGRNPGARPNAADDDIDMAAGLELPPAVPRADGGDEERERSRLTQRLIAELASRRMDSLRLYTPLPKQLEFHQSRARHRLVRGSNRSGKTLSAAAEIARAVTGQDPFRKYPLEGGRVFAVGKNERHLGDVMYRKLFRPQAFHVIKDDRTGLWRVFRPNDPEDAAREHERKPAPPLITRRYVGDIAWLNKKANQPQIIKLTTGWEINFFSSLGKPPQGSDVDIVWFDEEIVDPDWLPEMQARILDRGGRIIWSATPQAGTEHLFDLHERAEEELALPPHERAVEEFVVLIKDNDFMAESAKREFERDARRLGDDNYRVRVGGEFAIDSHKVYPEYHDHHLCDSFDIPRHWTIYAFVDPGRQVCAVLFVAVPPVNEDPYRYAFDEVYLRNADARKFGQAVAEKVRGFGRPIQAAWIDRHESRKKETGSGLTIEEQYARALKRAGVEFIETGHEFYGAPDDLKARILATHSWLNEDDSGITRLKVFRRCANLDREMRRYRYKIDSDGNVTDEPVKKRDHTCDCLGYAALVDPPYRKPKKHRLTINFIHQWLREKRAKRGREQGRPRLNLGPGK